MKLLYIPFNGTKKYSVSKIREIIKDNKYDTTFEVFGGSMCISANLVEDNLYCYANDYDGLKDKLENILKAKQEIHNKMLEVGVVPSGEPLEPNYKKILQDTVLDVTKKYNLEFKDIKTGLVYGATQTRNLSIGDFKYFTIKTDIPFIRMEKFIENLKKVVVDKLDYKDYLEKYKYMFDRKTLLIVDPPYLNTSQETYGNKETWELKDTIELLKILKKLGCDFLLFEKDKENIGALLELFDFNIVDTNIMKNTISTSNKKRINREECMLYIKGKKGYL